VVVKDHNRGGPGNQGRPEDFSRMGEDGIQRTDAGQVVASNPSARVQVEHNQALNVRIEVGRVFDVCSPVVGGALRVVAETHGVGGGTFPHGDNAPLDRLLVLGGGWMELLEEFKLMHDTPSAVRPLSRVAQGVVLLAGSVDGILFGGEERVMGVGKKSLSRLRKRLRRNQ
jgi:hypothetical protein